MLQTICIGHLGGDAEVKSANGKEFVAFRVANTDKWTDDAGNVHETTTWVDCIINGNPAVFPYLKKGVQVYVSGSCNLRVYSSAKDRCMKAGLSINVRSIELLGSKTDDVPAVLYRADNQEEVKVTKFYQAFELQRDKMQPESIQLFSRSHEEFVADRDGWVSKVQTSEE